MKKIETSEQKMIGVLAILYQESGAAMRQPLKLITKI